MPSRGGKSDILGSVKLSRFSRALLLLLLPRFATRSTDGPRDCKPCKKQVAMIAQKVMYANQPQNPGRGFVTLADPGAPALGAAL